MELELPHHNKPNYKGLGSKPHEIKSRVNKRDYNFAPTNAGIKVQLYDTGWVKNMQVKVI